MNNTTRALVMKFIMTFVFALLTLGFFDGNFLVNVLVFSVVATAANYVVGDLFILPNFGNTIASIADGIMAAGLAFIAAILFEGFRATLGTLILFAILVAIGEYFFHQYLVKNPEVAP